MYDANQASKAAQAEVWRERRFWVPGFAMKFSRKSTITETVTILLDKGMKDTSKSRLDPISQEGTIARD